MQIIKIFEDGTILCQLSVAESHLIQTALHKPIKRKVLRMTEELQKLEDSIHIAKEFNKQFTEKFYPVKSKRKRK